MLSQPLGRGISVSSKVWMTMLSKYALSQVFLPTSTARTATRAVPGLDMVLAILLLNPWIL